MIDRLLPIEKNLEQLGELAKETDLSIKKNKNLVEKKMLKFLNMTRKIDISNIEIRPKINLFEYVMDFLVIANKISDEMSIYGNYFL